MKFTSELLNSSQYIHSQLGILNTLFISWLSLYVQTIHLLNMTALLFNIRVSGAYTDIPDSN
jgi:hypothetical protein